MNVDYSAECDYYAFIKWWQLKLKQVMEETNYGQNL